MVDQSKGQSLLTIWNDESTSMVSKPHTSWLAHAYNLLSRIIISPIAYCAAVGGALSIVVLKILRAAIWLAGDNHVLLLWTIAVYQIKMNSKFSMKHQYWNEWKKFNLQLNKIANEYSFFWVIKSLKLSSQGNDGRV